MQRRIGVIDLGSNTTRLIVMAYQPGRSFKLVDEVSEVVRLAEGVGPDRMLQPRPMFRAIEALKMFHSFCDATAVDEIVAVGTSALREAANQTEFLAKLEHETGLQLRILSAEQEAYYGYLGAINSLMVSDGFVIDTGGGSTQVTEVRGRAATRFFSTQAGVVRFTERFVNSDPISKKDFRTLEEGAAAAFSEIEWFQAGPGLRLVGLGGTVRTLARIAQKRHNYPLDRNHGYVLHRDDLEQTLQEVRERDLRGRQAIPGLSRDRADVILAGAAILTHLMRQSGFGEMVVSGNGLREGLFYEHFLDDQDPPLFLDMRGFSVRNLAQYYNYEVLHTAKVRDLSFALFDQLQPLHGFAHWERELLGYAALLHDIGVQVGYYDHHKHSAYLVLNAALQGFSHREIVLLAMLVRNHRKGFGDLDDFAAVLAPDDEDRVARLSAMLRIAEYLERSKSQVVQDLRVEYDDSTITVRVQAVGDATVEVWDANRRTGLFKKAFNREITIV